MTHTLKQESLELLRQYHLSPSIAVRNQIVQIHAGLVRRQAYHWSEQCTESYEDLVQVGTIGLIRAIERFDITRGLAFSTFAVPFIRGDIQHYLRDKGRLVRLPRRWQELQHQVSSAQQALYMRLNRQPTDTEIAAELKLSIVEWQEIKQAYSNRVPLSLDTPVYSEEGELIISFGDLLADPQYQSFQLAQEDRMRLYQGLRQMEDQLRKVLELVFLQNLTQKEAAQRLQISPVTVSRRLQRGLKAMREEMMA